MSNKLKTIPLCQLRPSKTNMRKTDRNADIDQLAASIAANGLLENLVVQRVTSGEEPAFEVVAGGRKLAALKLLAKRKKIPRDEPIACLVLTGTASGLEASLAENFVRLPVHPADQFEAFAALAANGLTPDEIAARFGAMAVFVEQRLKLARVSPRLVAEYRAGAMTLEQLTAFTLSDDHAVQEQVWFESPYADISAAFIRRQLTSAQVEGSDRRARLIGAKAYEAAGGIIVRDLFDAEDEGYFADSQLLDKLVAEKLAATAEEIRKEGWQWVEVHGESHPALHAFERAATMDVPLADADQKRLATLAARYDELVAALEEEGSEDSEELDRVTCEISALEERQTGWSDEVKASAGAIVSLGPDGSLTIFRGLRKASGGNGKAETVQQKKEKRSGESNGYAEALVLDLSVHRTAALRAVVAGKPELALVALLHAMAGDLLYEGRAGSCLRIVCSEVRLGNASQTMEPAKASEVFQKAHAGWLEKIPEPDRLWSWIENLDDLERLSLLGHCVALTIDALDGSKNGSARREQSQRLAAAAGLDMAQWWRPTEANFFGRLTKNQILAAVSEGVSPEASRRLAPLKKDAMAKEAEKLLSNGAWLPPSLRADAPIELQSEQHS